jgi:hypothetical protein
MIARCPTYIAANGSRKFVPIRRNNPPKNKHDSRLRSNFQSIFHPQRHSSNLKAKGGDRKG